MNIHESAYPTFSSEYLHGMVVIRHNQHKGTETGCLENKSTVYYLSKSRHAQFYRKDLERMAKGLPVR